MGPFEMVVLIVLISVGAGVLNTWLKSRKVDEGQNEELEGLRRELSEVKERVSALETLAVDPDAALREKFKSLA